MGMKKGVFFTIDSILAGGIIATVIILVFSSYAKEQPSFHLSYLSQDLIRTLSTLTVEEADNEYLNTVVIPEYTDGDTTILEQIVTFWVGVQFEYATKTTSNITEPWVPDNIGYGLWIDDEVAYTRDMPIKKSLVSSKKLVSGLKKEASIDEPFSREYPPTLLGPFVIEIRVWQ